MVELLSGRHLLPHLQNKYPGLTVDELEIYPINPNINSHPVALLDDKKVIAAIDTDEKGQIWNLAGRTNLNFTNKFGHTPAMELLRHNLKRNETLEIQEGIIGRFAEHFLQKRVMKKGATAEVNEDVRTIKLPEKTEMMPALKNRPTVWRPYVRR